MLFSNTSYSLFSTSGEGVPVDSNVVKWQLQLAKTQPEGKDHKESPHEAQPSESVIDICVHTNDYNPVTRERCMRALRAQLATTGGPEEGT
jgi:hypothetical protein